MLVIRLWSKYRSFNNNRMKAKIIANVCTKNYARFSSPLEHHSLNIRRSKKYFEKTTYWTQFFNKPYVFENIKGIRPELNATHTPDKESGIVGCDAVSPPYFTAFEARVIFIHAFVV